MGFPFDGEGGSNVKEEITLQRSGSKKLEAQREVTVKVVRWTQKGQSDRLTEGNRGTSWRELEMKL